MKNCIFLLCSLAFLSFNAMAQNESRPAIVNWGEELKEPVGSRISKIIAHTSDGYYALRRKEETSLSKLKIYLEKYDKKGRLKKAKEIDLKYKKKLRDFENIIMLGGNLYLLTSFNNQVKQKNYLFAQRIKLKSFTLDSHLEKVGEIDSKDEYREGYFGFKISRDSTKLLIYNKLPYQRKQPEQFALRVFDKTFQEIWHKNIVLPYPDNQFSVEEYRIDRKGNVYVLGLVYTDGGLIRSRAKANYQYTILAYTNNGKDKEEYNISLKDKFVTDLTFRLDQNGNLVCSGFYSEKNAYSVKGTYYFRINSKTKEVSHKNLKAFDFNFLTEDFNNREKRRALKAEKTGDTKREAELYRFSLDDLILRSDGGALLVAEQYYIYETFNDGYNYAGSRYRFNNRFGYNQAQRDYYYNYHDIIVINIRPDGSIEWATRIPKQQTTINDGGYYSSYAMSIIRDRIYFVYNDNARNFEENRQNQRIYNFNGKNSIITLAEVTKDGELSIYPLQSNRTAEVLTRPKICKQIGRKEMAIYGEWGRSYRFGTIEFK